MNSQKISDFAPLILRLAMTAVFVWFGVSQILNTGPWVSLVPSWATGFGLNAVDVVHLNGAFELILALLLGTGFYVRWVAGLLANHLFVITTGLGLSATGVRDFGLSFATLAIAFFGNDKYCFSYKEEKNTSL